MAYGALGGGTWVVQNKKLPGTYFQTESQPGISNIWSDRGYVTLALPLSWGAENEIMTLTKSRVLNKSAEMLGMEYTDDNMAPIRELFKGASVVHLYNLNSGGTQATAMIAGLTVNAKHPGLAGNDIKVSMEININNPEQTLIDVDFKGRIYEQFTATTVEDFNEQNSNFITIEGTGSIADALNQDTIGQTLGVSLTGGTNGTVTQGSHADYLSKIQGKYFNVIAYAGTDETVKDLYITFLKHMVYDTGYMCQLVLHRADPSVDDFFINRVAYDALDWEEDSVAKEASSVFWYAGQSAGVELGYSISAIDYNGEYPIETITDVLDAERAIDRGDLVMIESGERTVLLEDINTFTNFSKEYTEDWALNEVVRTVMQRIQNISQLFNKYYMHKELNDDIGRNKLWADVTWSAEEQFQNQLRIITDYDPKDTTVEAGEQKGGVLLYDAITPVTTMNKLYLTVAIA